MKMVASARFPYNGRQLEKGDEFDVDHEIHGRILEHAGHATFAKTEPPPVRRPVLETAAMRAEDESKTTDETTDAGTSRRRRYQRRDVRAEE